MYILHGQKSEESEDLCLTVHKPKAVIPSVVMYLRKDWTCLVAILLKAIGSEIRKRNLRIIFVFRKPFGGCATPTESA